MPCSIILALSLSISHSTSLHACRGSISVRNFRPIHLQLLLLLRTCLLWQLLQAIGVWLGVCFFIFNKVICADNMKNILRPGFARTYSLLMDSPDNFSTFFFDNLLHIFCIFSHMKTAQSEAQQEWGYPWEVKEIKLSQNFTISLKFPLFQLVINPLSSSQSHY